MDRRTEAQRIKDEGWELGPQSNSDLISLIDGHGENKCIHEREFEGGEINQQSFDDAISGQDDAIKEITEALIKRGLGLCEFCGGWVEDSWFELQPIFNDQGRDRTIEACGKCRDSGITCTVCETNHCTEQGVVGLDDEEGVYHCPPCYKEYLEDLAYEAEKLAENAS